MNWSKLGIAVVFVGFMVTGFFGLTKFEPKYAMSPPEMFRAPGERHDSPAPMPRHESLLPMDRASAESWTLMITALTSGICHIITVIRSKK